MYLLMFGIGEQLSELGYRMLTFSLVLGAAFFIPYIIIVTLFGNRDVARFIAGGICAILLIISTQNGMFFNHFDITK